MKKTENEIVTKITFYGVGGKTIDTYDEYIPVENPIDIEDVNTAVINHMLESMYSDSETRASKKIRAEFEFEGEKNVITITFGRKK